MIVTVASYKGGVGKTTSAVHLAERLQQDQPTLLLDGDDTKNATNWGRRGEKHARKFPFRVASIERAAMLAREFPHIVIDTGQKPSADDLREAAEGSDLLIIPAMPDPLAVDGLGQTLRSLAAMEIKNYRVLVTCVAPDEAKEVAELHELLKDVAAPHFRTEIPRLKAFKKAAGLGITVRHVDDRQAPRAWAAYNAVGRELLEVLDGAR